MLLLKCPEAAENDVVECFVLFYPLLIKLASF